MKEIYLTYGAVIVGISCIMSAINFIRIVVYSYRKKKEKEERRVFYNMLYPPAKSVLVPIDDSLRQYVKRKYAD